MIDTYILNRVRFVRGKMTESVIVNRYNENELVEIVIADIIRDRQKSDYYGELQVSLGLIMARSLKDAWYGVIAREHKKFAPKTRFEYHINCHRIDEYGRETEITGLTI